MAELERTSPLSAPSIDGQASGSSFQGATPFPVAPTPAAGYASTLTEGALAKAPETAPNPPGIEALRHAVGSALAAAGHSSAAQLLGSGAWSLDGASLRIEVPGVGKKMLSLTVNAAAEKIIRQELQRLGAPTRFVALPGEDTAQASATVSAPPAGKIQEAALAHPLVQRAREIFKAEVRSVLDLRPK